MTQREIATRQQERGTAGAPANRAGVIPGRTNVVAAIAIWLAIGMPAVQSAQGVQAPRRSMLGTDTPKGNKGEPANAPQGKPGPAANTTPGEQPTKQDTLRTGDQLVLVGDKGSTKTGVLYRTERMVIESDSRNGVIGSVPEPMIDGDFSNYVKITVENGSRAVVIDGAPRRTRDGDPVCYVRITEGPHRGKNAYVPTKSVRFAHPVARPVQGPDIPKDEAAAKRRKRAAESAQRAGVGSAVSSTAAAFWNIIFVSTLGMNSLQFNMSLNATLVAAYHVYFYSVRTTVPALPQGTEVRYDKFEDSTTIRLRLGESVDDSGRLVLFVASHHPGKEPRAAKTIMLIIVRRGSRWEYTKSHNVKIMCGHEHLNIQEQYYHSDLDEKDLLAQWQEFLAIIVPSNDLQETLERERDLEVKIGIHDPFPIGVITRRKILDFAKAVRSGAY